jgi:hypothetical protein
MKARRLILSKLVFQGFTDIDAGWSVGLKEMGKLNEKPFQDACADKLSPKHSGAKASELYTLWQEVLNSPNWNPFKSVIVDGRCQVTRLLIALLYFAACASS